MPQKCPLQRQPGPIPTLQFRVLGQQQLRTLPLEPFDQIARAQRGRIRQMQVDMVFADDPFQNLYVQRIARLTD